MTTRRIILCRQQATNPNMCIVFRSHMIQTGFQIARAILQWHMLSQFFVQTVTSETISPVCIYEIVSLIEELLLTAQLSLSYCPHYGGPQGFWESGEKGYLFSGSWGALLITLGGLMEQAHTFGDLGSTAKKYT